MKEYIYRFADDTKSIVTVDDGLFEFLSDMDKEDKYGNRRETRRHISLDGLCGYGIDPAVSDTYDYGELFSDLQSETLSEVVHNPSVKQKGLLQKVFYERKRLKEIAAEEKVSPQLISWQLRITLEQLRANR